VTAVTSTAKQQPQTTILMRLMRSAWILPLLAVLAIAAFVIFRPIQVLPRITLSPGYVLADQDGNRLTSEDMRGKITLYNFTYTNCQPPSCTPVTPFMQSLQTRLPEVAGSVPIEFVTISIDPEHDTPQVLAAYAHELGADLDTWHFVTGSSERLKWVIGGGFGLYYDQRDDGTFTLDTGMMLVDWTGTLRAEYLRSLPDIDIVLRDLRLLQEEVVNSQGAGRIAYEAAHLFACYPR
ncbi:MAG: SCO family protein, partial [Anaerolineales bacterium]|nr:SCO family protein [Anaerolineales bacterium]